MQCNRKSTINIIFTNHANHRGLTVTTQPDWNLCQINRNQIKPVTTQPSMTQWLFTRNLDYALFPGRHAHDILLLYSTFCLLTFRLCNGLCVDCQAGKSSQHERKWRLENPPDTWNCQVFTIAYDRPWEPLYINK